MNSVKSLRRGISIGLALALGLTAFIDIAILVVPIYDMQLYDRVLMSRNMDTLAMLSVACAIGLLFYGVLDYLRSASFIAIADLIARRLHGPALAEGIRQAACGDRRGGPELIRNINELQTFMASGAVAVPLDALCSPMFVVILFFLHSAFGWLAIIGISSLILAGTMTEWLVAPELKRSHECRRAADHALSQSLADKEVIEGLGMLSAVGRRWCSRYASAVSIGSRASLEAQIIISASHLIRLCLQAGVMALGAVLIVRGETTPGSLMGANLLLNKCLGPFDHLVESCRSWALARQSWRGVSQLLTPESRSDAEITIRRSPADGLIVERVGVCLSTGVALIRDLSFSIEPGSLVVIAGPNGGGKTTLVRLLAGVIGPTQGRILLDGALIQGGSHIGYLPQSVSLLDASVQENIGRLAPELDQVFETARVAGIHNLIGRMPRGYETQLTADGSNISGGMRQRIGLARALYGNPRLLLLDEPDSSLDAEGSAALLQVLRSRCEEGAIAIVITHRPALKEAADRVITIKDGELVSDRAPQIASARQLETA